MASRIMYLVYDCPKLFSLRNLSIYSNLISQQYDNKAKTFNYIEFGCASLKPLLTRKPIGEKCQSRKKSRSPLTSLVVIEFEVNGIPSSKNRLAGYVL